MVAYDRVMNAKGLLTGLVALAIVGAAAPARAEPARAGGCSLWGESLTCGAEKSRYDCRAAGSGDVAPLPGNEKVLACRAAARGSGALAKVAVISADGKLLDVAGDRADTAATSVISSVKVENVVDDALREVVVEYSFDPALKVDLGNGRKGAVLRKELSILRWNGSALSEVFRACTNERPQPVSYARAAKVSYEPRNTIRVQAKQQEYSASEAKQWSSDVTYVWSPDEAAYLASSCIDLASHEHRRIALEEPEGDINAGAKCVATRPSRRAAAAPPPPAPPPPPPPPWPPVQVASAKAPANECRAPAGTTLALDRLDALPDNDGDCSWRAVKAALARSVRLDVAGRACGEPFTHRESFSLAGESSCTYELVVRGTLARGSKGWAFEEDGVELRSHCESGVSCRQGLTTGRRAGAKGTSATWAPPSAGVRSTTSTWGSPTKVAPAVGPSPTACLTRLQAEVAAGRLLQECYDRIAGEASNESLLECNVARLTSETCGD